MSLKVHLQVPKQQLKATADELRKVDKKLPAKFRKLLVQVARPIMNEQRAAVRGMPSKGKKSRGTRKRIASGVKMKLRTSRWPTMRIITAAPWPEERNDAAMLPRGFDTFFNGFDTPYGHQTMSGPSWFVRPAAKHQREMEQAVIKILGMTAREIAQAASRNMKVGRPSLK